MCGPLAEWQLHSNHCSSYSQLNYRIVCYLTDLRELRQQVNGSSNYGEIKSPVPVGNWYMAVLGVWLEVRMGGAMGSGHIHHSGNYTIIHSSAVYHLTKNLSLHHHAGTRYCSGQRSHLRVLRHSNRLHLERTLRRSWKVKVYIQLTIRWQYELVSYISAKWLNHEALLSSFVHNWMLTLFST